MANNNNAVGGVGNGTVTASAASFAPKRHVFSRYDSRHHAMMAKPIADTDAVITLRREARC